MSRIYKLQELKGNSYFDFEGEYVIYNVESIEELPLYIAEELSLHKAYTEIEVPKVVSDLVYDFCNTHRVNISPGKIITLICGAQKTYIGSPQINWGESHVKDFFTQIVELRELLELIKEYKFSRGSLDLQSVRFAKSDNKTLKLFRNTWIIQRLFDGLILEMKLDVISPEEFDKQAKAVISKFNLAKPLQIEYYIKGIVLKAFRHYLDGLSTYNQTYRNECAGVFLNCAQIPLNSDQFFLSPIFIENFGETDYKHINLLIERLPKSFL